MRNVSRRQFLAGASSTLLLAQSCWAPALRAEFPHRGERSGVDAAHLPALRVPARTRNGGHVPVRIGLDHPMDPDHFIESIHLFNPRDPIPSKGSFHFTPRNGEAYLATQVRLDSGTSPLTAVAFCSRHGEWRNTAEVTIPEGKGGCATAAEANASGGTAAAAPLIRIPELVRRGKLREGQIAEVQIKLRHPTRTGLAYENGRFVQQRDPYYVETLEISYGGESAGRYEMTPGISDSPFIAFKLKCTEEKALEVVARDNRGAEYRARKEIHLS